MVQISKKRIDRRLESKLDDLLFVLLGKKEEKGEFFNVINSIFSNIEKIMILKRIGLIYLLLKGITKSNIRKILGLSKSTLDKYGLLIEKNPELYKNFIKIIKKDKLISFFEDLLNTIYGVGTPGVNWSDANKKKYEIRRKKRHGI